MTITISISDDRAAKLKEHADKMGVKVEDVARMLIEKATDQSEIDENSAEFGRAMDEVFAKNAELYRRLA